MPTSIISVRAVKLPESTATVSLGLIHTVQLVPNWAEVRSCCLLYVFFVSIVTKVQVVLPEPSTREECLQCEFYSLCTHSIVYSSLFTIFSLVFGSLKDKLFLQNHCQLVNLTHLIIVGNQSNNSGNIQGHRALLECEK